jgi:gamma-glutamylaminecyclotransferase
VKLFVYGTLKQGFSRNQYLRDQRFDGKARTVPRYRLFDCGSYPGLVPAPIGAEGRSIEGEIWDVDAVCLTILDKVEAVGEGLYRRERVELETPFDAMTVETYYFNQSTDGLCDCGDRWE